MTLGESEAVPEEIQGLNFGIYETENGYCVYLSGAEQYDPEDSDWACDKDYEPKEKYKAVVFSCGPWSDMHWENFLKLTKDALKQILRKKNEKIDTYIGNRYVTTGFDDGDLFVIKKRRGGKSRKMSVANDAKRPKGLKEYYYNVLMTGKSGVLHEPEGWPFPIVRWAQKEFKDLKDIELELRDGEYPSIQRCGSVFVVSEEIKNLLEEHTCDNDGIEFIPVKAKSEKYGISPYYVINFNNTQEDVVSKPHSTYILNSLTRFALDYDKVNNKKIFLAAGSYLLLSEDIAKAMKKRKLTKGVELLPIAAWSDKV